MQTFELKLKDGSIAYQQGDDGLHAATLYAGTHRGVTVVAWKPAGEQTHGVFVVHPRQIEP